MKALRAVIVFVVVTGLMIPGVYELAVLIHPPVTADGLHPVMPIGQAGAAIVIGPLLGIAAAVLSLVLGRKPE
jgi:hypothetical protein